MPVYLLTYHAYRSWMPDRRQGYVKRGQGILPRDDETARVYNRRAKHPPVQFDEEQRRLLIETAATVCRECQWELYEMVAVSSHVHLLLGWRSDLAVQAVSNRLKRRLGAARSKAADKPGPWFSRGLSRKRVADESHFGHLCRAYLPQHGSIRWSLLKQALQ